MINISIEDQILWSISILVIFAMIFLLIKFNLFFIILMLSNLFVFLAHFFAFPIYLYCSFAFCFYKFVP